MSARKQHAYAVALRMAQVDELRAQSALAAAVAHEHTAKEQVDAVETARHAVASANGVCLADGRLDLARYELLTQLDAALSQRLLQANTALGEATQQRSEKASANVSAKRRRERIGEHLDEVRHTHAHQQAAKSLEDGIELWLGSRKETL
ncbi:hypothetical protein [Dyella acidiphila]|uniref:Flagellar FliJ protein n=1 Tax=Dyella acidiphila TaxID=2775866 RepID=A0ABR9GFE3_9GAMM|nr:hypothetical protein [Dyella acidiphila]MBE1162741.1 hypothetical protein [Dyella acidiphila]